MKFVIIVQNMAIGGVARLIADEINEMHRRDIEVWLIVFEPEQVGNTLRPECLIPPEQVIYIPYRRMRDGHAFLQIVRAIRRIKPEVVFTHHWFANTVGRLAAFFAGVPSIAFEHSVYDTVKSRRQFFFDWVLQFVSRRIVAVSHSVEESLVSHRICRSRIAVIKNGIDLHRYVHGTSHKPHEFTFIFVGRLVSDKAVDIFLKALARVPHVRALIVGTGPEEAALKKLSRQLEIEDRVEFLGARSDVPELLHTADALVLPSYREGFGLVVIEARAAGLPVVLSDFPASTEIIEDDVQGIIVPRGNVEALAEALGRLSSDTELYRQLAEAAPKGLERFSIEQHVDKLMALAERP